MLTLAEIVKTLTAAQTALEDNHYNVTANHVGELIAQLTTAQQSDKCGLCDERTEYNGWTNYETWAAFTWITNDQSTDTYARELVAEAYTEAHSAKIVSPRADAADALRDWFENENPMINQETSGVYTDLMQHAIERVDWYAVALALAPEEQPGQELTRIAAQEPAVPALIIGEVSEDGGATWRPMTPAERAEAEAEWNREHPQQQK